MNASEIKKAIEAKQQVFWKNESYEVIKDSKGEFIIECCINNHRISLTWDDGETLKYGKPEEFYTNQKPFYMLLSRLQQDCDYYLGNGGRCEKHLWANNPKAQITEMKKLYNALLIKPEWLTMVQIEEYEKQMTKKTVATCPKCGVLDDSQTDDRFCDVCNSWIDFNTDNEETGA